MMLIKKSRVPLLSMLTLGLLPSFLKVAYYRLRGHRIGRRVRIGPLAVLIAQSVEIGGDTTIGFATILRGRSIRIGRHARICPQVFFDGRGFQIGDDAEINEQHDSGVPTLPE